MSERVKKYSTWEEMNAVRKEIRSGFEAVKVSTNSAIAKLNDELTDKMHELNDAITKLKQEKRKASDALYKKIADVKEEAFLKRRRIEAEIDELEQLNQDLIYDHKTMVGFKNN